MKAFKIACMHAWDFRSGDIVTGSDGDKFN